MSHTHGPGCSHVHAHVYGGHAHGPANSDRAFAAGIVLNVLFVAV